LENKLNSPFHLKKYLVSLFFIKYPEGIRGKKRGSSVALDRVLPKDQGVPKKGFHFSLFTDAPLLGHYPTLKCQGLGLMLFLTSFSLLIKEMVITDKGLLYHYLL
jgi:hypothetical protein